MLRWIAWQLDIEAIAGGIAFRPDLTAVFGDNTAGNGQPKTKAAVAASGFVRPVEALKDLFQFIWGDGLPGVGHRQ